ncbi:TRAP transporter large permease subunit [Limnobacter humi]|uniref:TRAP transporter large permease subunit n=1 Tax=Limnobacter humi TaxID=1778671 RepID=A0ABT1WHF7_9BURK|nr:TRAP transporter large permease subunit [Limnobacter humi]MCQ8896952.1 TRAP transporter large permease subunit [Limnobacter humi]
METTGRRLLGRTVSEWFFGLPIIGLLIFTLIIGTGEMVHGQLLKIGESMFGVPEQGIQYFMLRGDNPQPTCTLVTDIDAEVARQMAAPKADDSGLGDLMGEMAPANPDEIREAVVAANKLCQEETDRYTKVAKLMTGKLKTFTSVETGFFDLFKTGTENRPLVLLIMVALAAVITTVGVHHVVIRPPLTVLDYRFGTGAIGIASIFGAISSVAYYNISANAGVKMEHPITHFIWIALFVTLAGISLKQVLRPPTHLKKGGTVFSAMLSVPLFGMMGIVAGVYFFTHGNWPGLAIYVNQLLELPSIFLSLALYIWAGMLLKQSRIVDLFMNILRPWKLSPELLTYIILLAAALPTAYTGASGIFVIAAGGIVYNEVRAAGGTRQFALAATAMSGSLGVVLRPCLLVVLIAALNKQVTSSALYHYGFYVFLLTSTLFFIFSQLTRRKKAAVERPLVALPKMMREIVPVLPYVALVMAVVLGYKYLLDTELNESSAPVIMPAIMFILLVFDKLRTPKGSLGGVSEHGHVDDRKEGVEPAIRFATSEAVGHIGALIMLMALSLAIGGVVERSGIMDLAPKTFSNAWTAMTFLMITKVILGMVMDPFGAVILVSGTLAPIAYNNGIDPLHFWMMVLVAFELGYLMPPVALNQLLTRLVIGDDEVRKADNEVKRKSFYWRYERWILPTVVMTVGMLITAYGPLAVQKFEVLKPLAHLIRPAEHDAAEPVPVSENQPAAAGVAEPVDAAALPVEPQPVEAPSEPIPTAEPAALSLPASAALPAAADPAGEIDEALMTWATAWSNRDVGAYLAAYSPDFVSAKGVKRPAWDSERKQKIESKQSISIRLKNTHIEVQGDTATAEFIQEYQSDVLKETSKKRVTFVRKNGAWLIAKEDSR